MSCLIKQFHINFVSHYLKAIDFCFSSTVYSVIYSHPKVKVCGGASKQGRQPKLDWVLRVRWEEEDAEFLEFEYQISN